MKLLLVDGHALAYRGYFAMIRNPLTNERGENTSAEFGFIRTLRATLREHQPDALLVCFDPKGKTFRHELYPEYKAQRPKMPEDLRDSIEQIFNFCDVMGYSWLRREGYEADDVLASAATQAAAGGWDVLLMTGDKDLCQIVDEKIHVLRPASGAKEARILDPAGVSEEFGVSPNRILDYLSLIGDSSDNIPGVPGMGPKTSLKVLAEFSTIDEIFANLENVSSAAARKKLAAGKESALFSRDLIRLVCDLDLAEGPDQWSPGPGDNDAMRNWFLDRGFHTLLNEFEKGDFPREELEYSLILDEEALSDLVEKLHACDRFAVDTETTGLDTHVAELVGISLALAPGEAFYLPVLSEKRANTSLFDNVEEQRGLSADVIRQALAALFSDPRIEKVAQNLKFDADILERFGLPLTGPFFDTMLASYCVDPARRSHGLDAQVLDRIGHEMMPYSALFEKGDRERDIRTVPLAKLGHYAAEDADFTLRLADQLVDELAEKQVESLFKDLEMPLLHVLRRMENEGVALDTEHLASLSTTMEARMGELTDQIHADAGREFTIGSPKQLSAVLFDELGLPPGKRTKTGFSTDEEVLSELATEHAIAGRVLEWRELTKLRNTYIDVLPEMISPLTGRIHTSFNQAVTSTGRLSSSDPNLQNIPIRTDLGKEIRKAFIAPPGRLLAAFDYSQVELRILAHLSNDEALVEAFTSGRDIHTWTAARIGGKPEADVTRDERSRSKMVNFGVLYGMGAGGLSRRLQIPRKDAQAFIDDYFGAFPGIKIWMASTLSQARAASATCTLMGRRRELPDINSKNGRISSFAERVAINTPIQGTAADLIKKAMLAVDSFIKEDKLVSRMLLQVHDELLFETTPDELEHLASGVKRIMEGVADFRVPLLVDWGSGSNWLEAH
ncbi:MAG: DNA polymerase I [bacterium]|nr:DNA polymerase I [bacterium]